MAFTSPSRKITNHLEAAYALAVKLQGPLYAPAYLENELSGVIKAATPPQPPRYTKARIPNALRKRVFERDGYRCRVCGGWHDLTVDHIKAEVIGGETTYENLQTMCRSCNGRKGARP